MLCRAVSIYVESDWINATITQHPSSLYLSRARLKWSKGSIDFQSIASLSFAAARSAHVYCMSQKSLPFPPGFAVIRFQFDAAGEGRPHRWYAADGSDGVSLEYGPAAFFVFLTACSGNVGSMGDPRSASWMSCSFDTERVQILVVFVLRMRRRWQWFSGVRSASPREVFKLTKLWRNYHEVAELRKRQSPAALQGEVMRALQMKSFAHARKIMEANADVDFVLQGPSGEDHEGQPMLVLEKPLSSAEVGKLVAAVAAAREAVLSGKIREGDDVRDFQVCKVTCAAGAHPAVLRRLESGCIDVEAEPVLLVDLNFNRCKNLSLLDFFSLFSTP